MPLTNFPQGVSSFGIPQIGYGVSIPQGAPNLVAKQGTVWFVNGTAGIGADGNEGTDPTVPFATIGRAITLAGDGTGDTIFVYPGTYVEAVNVGTKSNISIIATEIEGNAKRVAIAPTTGIALTLGAGIRFYARGIRFVGTSGAGCLTQNEGQRFDNCDFTSDTTHGIRFKGTVDANHTGSGTVFNGCVFRECGGAGIHIEIGTGGAVGLYPTNVNVYGSQFYLNTDDDINDDAAGGALAGFSQWDISGNHFMTLNKTTYLDLNGTTGGSECLVSGNYFAVNTAAGYATEFQMPSGSTGAFAGNFSGIGVIDGHTF